jgi:putative serine protease PepD
MDDDPDDGEPFDPPLPPDDRLWRHPSEMAAQGRGERIELITRPSRGRVLAASLVGMAVGIAGTFGLVALTGAFDAEAPGTAVERVLAAAPNESGGSALAIAERSLPAVVRMEATSAAGMATGTAVVVRDDGYLLTSATPVDGADTVTIILDDGSREAADVVGRDRASDVAVLKVARAGLPVATMTDQPQVAFGDATVVIDAAPSSGPAPALIEGFVADANRRVDRDDGTSLYGMIEVRTRATIGGHQGTGGVLLDEQGSVVGLLSAQTPGGDDGTTLSPRYAVPVEHARHVFESILTVGRYESPFLGTTGRDLDGDAADRAGVAAGVIVDAAQGPAADAGLKPDDVIIGIDGTAVTSLNDLVVMLREHQPGDTVALTYVRRGSEAVALATLESRPGLP